MNRIIKFRGKDEQGCWHMGWLEGTNDGRFYILENDECWTDDGFHNADFSGSYEVLEKTIGQFTGLVDKNGVEIYEGDIVECVSWNEYFNKDVQPMELFRRKMYVDFRRGGFKMVEPMPEPMKDNEWDIIYNGDIVIFGNVFDNPDLIK